MLLRRLKDLIRRRLARRLAVPEIPVALDRLRQQGFNPRLIFDVGAYQGDFARECLSIWPGAKIACFEPQPHMQKDLMSLPADRVLYFQSLLGADSKAEVLLHCAETASSVLIEHFNKHPNISVPQTTVDLVSDKVYKGQVIDLFKIDVQGYELEVLKGSEGNLPFCSVILLELNLIEIHEGVPLAHEIFSWLNERGFVLFDICGLGRRPRDQALWQIDAIFVPENSGLRTDKHWD